METTPIPVCRFLRTKKTIGFVVDGAVVPWESGEDATAAYWCVASAGPIGPDDALAHPHACRGGRICYRERS